MSLFLVATAGSVLQPPFHMGVDDLYNELKKDFDAIGDRILVNFGDDLCDVLWPRSSFLGSLADGDMTPSRMGFNPVRYEWDVRWQGNKNRKKFSGLTKDSNGDPLAGCTVDLFRTLDDAIVASVVSDTIGYYELYSPYDTAHYLVASKAGATYVSGATINTILGN